MLRAFTVFVVLGLMTAHAVARLHRFWTHEELLAESDLVVLFEPLANQPTEDIFTIDLDSGHKIKYKGIDTRFRVDVIFKPDGIATKELTVLHFSDENAEPVANGPVFIYFPIGPLEYEKRFSKNGEELGKMTVHQGEPLLLAFLKRRPDGRYEPVTGQEDPGDSFYEVHAPFFPYP